MATHRLPSLLLGLIALLAVDDPGPAKLVTQLGAASYADREKAGEALFRIGRRAVPAVVKACKSRDAEVRLRAETLVARIEAAELLEATRVKLEIRDRPLAEAALAIEKASGMRLKPCGNEGNPQVARTWPERRVTLEAAEPVPFWDATDRLCQAADMRREYPPAWNNAFPFNPPFDLILVPGRARPPASDTGALRVELLRVRHLRDRDYGNHESEFSPFPGTRARTRNPKPDATGRSSYAAELLVTAEPRLRIFGVGDVEKSQAIDDQRRPLRSTPIAEAEEHKLSIRQMNANGDPRLEAGLRYGSGSHPSNRIWPVSIPLTYPSPPARRIALLRGIIPVVVVARRPDPLVVPLNNASGKEFSAGSSRITVHDVKADGGQDPIVDFTLATARSGADETIMVCDPKGAPLAVRRPVDLMELCLEVVDGCGDTHYWQFTSAPTEGTEGRMAIVIRGTNSKRVPLDGLRLRYWTLIGAATDLPFVFKDVPTP